MPTLPAVKNVNTAKEKATGAKLAGPSSLRKPRDMLHLLPRRSQENPLLGSIRRKEAVAMKPAALRLSPLTGTEGGAGAIG